jgi:hypothetical protein
MLTRPIITGSWWGSLAIALLEAGYDLEMPGPNVAEWLSGYRDAASV